jgi:hypothetical protein
MLAALLLVALSSAAPAQSVSGSHPADGETPSWAKIGIPWGCRYWNLPKEFEYDAIGVYQGQVPAKRDDEPYLKSPSRIWAIDVNVTSTERPVVLLLSSYESVKWKINVKDGSTLAGIVVTGYHPSIASVVDRPRMKTLNVSGLSNRCGHGVSASSSEHFDALLSLAKSVAGRSLSTFQSAYEASTFTVGPGATDVGMMPPEDRSFVEDNAEIKALVSDGTLHLATEDEKLAWLTADPELTKLGVLRATQSDFSRVYMVTKQFKFPAGMHGSHSRGFIIPKGIKLPTGDWAHNVLYFMKPYKGCISMGGASACQKAPKKP